MKKSKIYTRGGDTGNTTLIGGTQIAKNNLRLEAYGTIDEFNAHLGLLAAMVSRIGDERLQLNISNSEHSCQLFTWLQSRLFDAGTHLATPSTNGEVAACSITVEDIQKLELLIDNIDSQLTPLRCFILPGGSIAASQCHVCRTICRRAERVIITLTEKEPISPLLLSFINRMSDFLFVYARLINKIETIEEISWKKGC